jgi:exodeoxyribonuclease-3
MKIASFNVNSVKARLNNLTQWLSETNPDVVCLQELKQRRSAWPKNL